MLIVLARMCCSNAHEGHFFKIVIEIYNLEWKFIIILLDGELTEIGIQGGTS